MNIVEHGGGSVRAHAVVRSADVRARIALAHGVDEQVAQQKARVVVRAQVQPVFRPGDLRGRDAAGHALQHQPLAFGHHDGSGRRRVDDASRFGHGA